MSTTFMRQALRGFLRNPAFTITAVLTIALGIGASAAVFSVVDRVLFRSLPYPEGERLVSLGLAAPIEPTEFMLGADYLEWRAAQTPFESMTTFGGMTDCDLTEGVPAWLRCARVEANFLDVLRVQPTIGRNFTPEEDRPNGPKAALLSYGLWQSRFGGDRAVAGRTFSLDGQTATVAGVLPQGFELPTLSDFDLLIPQALDIARQQRPATGAVMRSFARLKPGVSVESAHAQLQPLFERSLQFVPPSFRNEVKLRVRSLWERQTEDARLVSWVLLASVLAVLLIACANVGNLMLARTASRQHELAVRAALGAGRLRLVWQTLTESFLLGLAGGVAGCALAYALLRIFVTLAPDAIPHIQQASIDLRVLLFGLAAATLAGLVFGIAPALQSPRPESLTGARSTGPSRTLFRQALVIAQIAISMTLLTSAALLVRTFWNLQSTPLGMSADRVMTASITLGQQRYSQPAQRWQFFEQLESRLQRVPGFESVAVADSVPPSGQMRSRPYAAIEVFGRPKFAAGTGGMIGWRLVTPQYFRVLQVPVLAGRTFQEEDRRDSEHAVVLSSSLARRLFPNEKAEGKQLRFDFEGPWFQVIGVTADVKNGGIAEEASPEYYIVRKHVLEDLGRRATAVVRSPLAPEQVAKWIRAETAALDSTLPVTIATMPERVGKLSERPRFNALLLTAFAGLGLALAAVGLYGVIAFLVSQRTREIGVRMAVGATPGDIRRLVLGRAAVWTAAGTMIGLAGSLFATRWLGSLLYQVPARDPITLSVAVVLLTAVALAAAWLPSRRASRVEPMPALRA